MIELPVTQEEITMWALSISGNNTLRDRIIKNLQHNNHNMQPGFVFHFESLIASWVYFVNGQWPHLVTASDSHTNALRHSLKYVSVAGVKIDIWTEKQIAYLYD